MAKISVIVPIFNVEKYVAQCLDSIINQTYKDLEIICVDDCGQDSSMRIVEKYAQNDKRIKIIKHDTNKGLGCARNTGVQNSTGKYIACVDSDDWIDFTMFEKCINKLEEYNFDSVWVKVNTYVEDEDRYTTDNYYKSLFECPGGVIEIKPDNINKFSINAWNKVYRADFIKENNIEWSKGLLYEDVEFFWRFYTKSFKLFLIDELLYFYRCHPNSIMSKTELGKSRCEDMYDITENIYKYLISENLFEEYNDAFAELALRHIYMFKTNQHYTERVIPRAKRMLENIKFPEDYPNYKNRNTFIF